MYVAKALNTPQEDIIRVIIFEKTNDFVIIDNSKYNQKEIDHMAMMERESISRLNYGGRSGGSGSVVYSSTNSHSLSAFTKKNNSILNSHIKGVGLSCTYLNDKGAIKSYKSIYNNRLKQWMDNDDKLRF